VLYVKFENFIAEICFNCLVYRQLSANFMVVTTVLFAHTTFLWATCYLICFIPIVKPFLTHCIERVNWAHGGCYRSTRDAYSSMAPDPTSDIFRGPCTPILWYVFPIGLMRLITDRYFCHFIGSILTLRGPASFGCAKNVAKWKITTTCKKWIQVLQNDYKHTGYDNTSNYKINLAISFRD
jgi:hypothetical protein